MGLQRIESPEQQAIAAAVKKGDVVIVSHDLGDGSKEVSALAAGKDGKPAVMAKAVTVDGKTTDGSVHVDVLDRAVANTALRSNPNNFNCPLSDAQLATVNEIMKKAAEGGYKVHPDSNAVVVPKTKVAEPIAGAIQQCAR